MDNKQFERFVESTKKLIEYKYIILKIIFIEESDSGEEADDEEEFESQ